MLRLQLPTTSILSRRYISTNKSRVHTDMLLRSCENAVVIPHNVAISRIDVCQVQANRPVEDFYSATKCLASDGYIFAVIDGHAGPSCASSTLEKHLLLDIPIIERALWLFSTAEKILPNSIRSNHENNIYEFYKKFKADGIVTVRQSLQAAFVTLDQDLIRGAEPDNNGRVNKLEVNTANSGACALVAHIRKRNIHIANIGDCIAVLGILLPTGIIARQLNKPHTVENIDEVTRIRSEHPSGEFGNLLKNGRLLGELMPLRAFGDVRFKWSRELQRVILEPLGFKAPRNLQTPPYLTAQPEVFYHKLTSNDKFLILATDGLWEFLDPETAARLVYDHKLGARTLIDYQPQSGESLGSVFKELESRKEGHSRRPLDSNSATHLVRNALGGCSGGLDLQYARLEESLCVPPGMARHYRDDISVVVIHFNEKFLSD